MDPSSGYQMFDQTHSGVNQFLVCGKEIRLSMKPCYCGCSNRKVKRGLWSPDEDEKLRDFINVHGIKCWSLVPIEAGLERCGKSCRLRWLNYLRPGVKRGNFSLQEQHLIFELQALFGNRWSWIARRIPGRTDNEIKNFWNVCKARQRMNNGSPTPASTQFCSQISNYNMAVPFRTTTDAHAHENVKLCNSMSEVRNADANSNVGVSYYQEAPNLYAQPLNGEHVADIESLNELSTWQVDLPTWQTDMAGFQADMSNFDWTQVMQSHDLSFLSQNGFA